MSKLQLELIQRETTEGLDVKQHAIKVETIKEDQLDQVAH